MHLRHVLDDGQAQAGAACLPGVALVHPVEALKHMGQKNSTRLSSMGRRAICSFAPRPCFSSSWDISVIHTGFNLAATAVLLPMNKLLVKMAYAIIPRENTPQKQEPLDALVREVKSRHVRRLRDGLCTVEYGFVLEDLLTACERTADHCSNVAVEMLQVSEGKLEAHEYLNALKAGELHESAAFAEQFAKYKALYAFPEE